MKQTKDMPTKHADEVVKLMRENAAKGGRATFKKYGSKHMKKLARKRWKKVLH